MALIIGNIEFYCGPKAAGSSETLDHLEDVIVDFIKGTKDNGRLEIAVQELDNIEIAKAILDARKRKVIVKLVIEQDYLRTTRFKNKPFVPGGTNETNREIHNAILRSNIDIKCDYNTSIFHQKFIIRDRSSVLTGSTNFTDTGTHKNLNHIVIVHDIEVAKVYGKEFREIQRGHFGKYNEGHDKAPKEVVVSNIPIRILFAPDHNPEMEIMKQLLKAKQRVDFAIFTFAKSSGIDDTIIRLRDLGMSVRGVFDAKQGGQKWSATHTLKDKGAELYEVKHTKTIGKLHHKLMVLDDQVVIAGSFNYTGPANRVNDENIIILGDLHSPSPLQNKLAKYARKEIDRIIHKHSNPLND